VVVWWVLVMSSIRRGCSGAVRVELGKAGQTSSFVDEDKYV